MRRTAAGDRRKAAAVGADTRNNFASKVRSRGAITFPDSIRQPRRIPRFLLLSLHLLLLLLALPLSHGDKYFYGRKNEPADPLTRPPPKSPLACSRSRSPDSRLANVAIKGGSSR